MKVASKLETLDNTVFFALAKCFGRLFGKLNIGESEMTRQEQIEDFQHFLDTHKEEVEAHLSEPQLDWFEDDGWDDKEKIK